MKFIKMIAVLLSIFCLTVSGRAFASEADMQAFRDTFLRGMSGADGYHLELMFHGPTFQSNAIADGLLWKNGSAVMEGKLNWGYTELATGQTQQNEMPFYAERSGDVITLYGNRKDTWQRENILGSLSWILDAISSDDMDRKTKYAAAVTDVKVTDAGNNRQDMQITFDGKALSVLQDKAVRDRIANMSEADGKAAMASVRYLNAALAERDPQCVWQVDRETGKTSMVTADLTEIMRNYAKAVLQDSYQGKIALSQEDVDFLASIGYYYNLQLYLMRDTKVAKQVVIPAAVKNGAVESNIFADIENQIISVVKK